ncbi:hypothetical protein F5Y05DRAFT_298132 [Hypoxylon sp. FL0543]|nr:hypothetical protein F5Y05DRAFT_298132 [Hypoxylon sp. FL0543]
MTTNNTSVVNLGDQEHPNLHLTKMNAQTLLLQKLHPQLRLMIYEFAVYVDEPIEPVQITQHSNKFFDANSPFRLPTVVSLSQACRAIYAELEYNCPFYKVNRFRFTCQVQLNAYLAAITPQRRSNIWWIDLSPALIHYTTSPVWSLNDLHLYTPAERKNNAILAQLSQCDALRRHELSLEVYISDTASDPGDFLFALTVLKECLAWARDPSAREKTRAGRSIWCLPFFRLKIIVDGPSILRPIIAQLM